MYASPSSKDAPSTVMYRPFDSWVANSDWQVSLPPGEEAVAVTSGHSFSALATSQHMLRLFSPAGAPLLSAGLTCAIVPATVTKCAPVLLLFITVASTGATHVLVDV